jgi:acyl-CoA thioesterase
VAQGGAVFTLADLAFAAASNGAGQVAVAAQVAITYHKAGRGLLTAVAREVSRSRRLSACEVVVTDREGERVATFQGLAYVKQESVAALPAPRVRRRGAGRRPGK